MIVMPFLKAYRGTQINDPIKMEIFLAVVVPP